MRKISPGQTGGRIALPALNSGYVIYLKINVIFFLLCCKTAQVFSHFIHRKMSSQGVDIFSEHCTSKYSTVYLLRDLLSPGY